MAEKKGRFAMGQLGADRPGGEAEVSPTIVGGQPPGALKRTISGLPVGIERVLVLAAVEPEFLQELRGHRLAAVDGRGLTLSRSERAMLGAIPEAQLEATVRGLDTSERNLQRRSFLRTVAAGAVTIAAGEALIGCSDEDEDRDAGLVSEGIRPDMPPNLDASVSRGISPDMPPPADGPPADAPADDGPLHSELGSYGIRPDR